MNNREKYKQAFSVLHASDTTKMEVKTVELSKYSMMRRITAACAGLILVLGTGMVVYAYGGHIVRQIFGWGNNMTITNTIDPETEENKNEVMVMTDSLTKPIIVEDDRIIFVVNGEHIDITDQMSETEPYSYEYEDEEGYKHYWFVGINNAEKGEYGFGEYIMDTNGEWAGGYSAWTNLDENGDGPEWLEIGKDKIGCPW